MSADEITPQSLQFANAINEVAKSLDTLKHNLAEAELAAERERADRNQEDAERYRWVRMNRLWLKANLPTISAIHFDRKIDAAIDAARRP